VSDHVGYIKDIGVCAEFREQGIATALLGQLMSVLRQSCAPDDWVLARTLATPEPSVVFKWLPPVGFKEVTYYPGDSDRSGQVILGNTFEAVSL
jgi:ribosomal protein S18 acetylase RimI-like enzyme